MAAIDDIRNILISKLMTIQDQDILSAIDKLISSSVKDQKTKLTEEQVMMLKMSEDDIQSGRIITQEDLFQKERMWLNGK